MFRAKHRKHHAMPCDWKETDASDTHATREFYYSLMIPGWWSEIFRFVRCVALLFSVSFPRSWEIGLTRNKRGERSVQVHSWRKDKIGVAGGIIFARTFEVRRPGFSRDAIDSAKQEETGGMINWKYMIEVWKRKSRGCWRPRTLVCQTRGVSRSCNQMPDWIISIIWNVYGADKDPKCTSCRSLWRRTRIFRAIDEADTSRAW